MKVAFIYICTYIDMQYIVHVYLLALHCVVVYLVNLGHTVILNF